MVAFVSLTLLVSQQVFDLPATCPPSAALQALAGGSLSLRRGGPARSCLNTDLFLQLCPEQPQ